MTLAACLEARGLNDHLRAGLKALGPDSARVKIARPRRAAHSVALDAALAGALPHAPRWDYGIGLTAEGGAHVAWVEVHTATSSEVEAVLKKLAWLKQWLADGQDVCAQSVRSFHWVATDAGVHIDSARRRRLNAAGLRMPQSHLRL
jgi:hypothetical protein